MGRFSKFVDFLLGRHHKWGPTSDFRQMKRWHSGRWEYRDLTYEEYQDAYAWWATK